MQPNTEDTPTNTPEPQISTEGSISNINPQKQVSDFLPPKSDTKPPLDELKENDTPTDQEGDGTTNSKDTKDTAAEEDLKLFAELKDDRDKLRGVREERDTKRTQRILKGIAITVATILLLSLIGLKIFKSLNKPETVLQHQNFVLPADLNSKSADEQAAINVINLARKGDFDQIITKWLGSKDLSNSKEDFKNLIISYETSADGEKVELVEKKVGKTNLGVEGAEEVNAVSLIYRSSYFEHPNNLYTKLNLYESATTPGAWKLYLFEFKAQDDNQPPKADLSV
jgi:hypothetical protein